ncbi:MAG: NADH:flavin oxidoreductase/NADH oxidase [Bacteroidales bacterium]|nr:NADH:flavin oxidoreductase/NADH oxidase [Bacteroidales bacterium]MBN2756324.1 NADH:flavin oxidoreductase/NADH oxidase [Bacteroidales bacterium]
MLFEPIIIKNLKSKNRIVMAPMCTYQAVNGFANNSHLIHYASRAIGQTGIIILEATAIEPRGRISVDDLGLWSDEFVDGLKSITDECKNHGSKIGIQLAHAGRKSRVLDEEIVAPSSLAFNSSFPTPHELSKDEIEEIILKFGEAAKRADKAGFDFVEIHAAHGYLINQFLSPITNKRTDEYGNDKKLFLERVLKEVRANFSPEKTIFVRVSAEEYNIAGNNPENLGELLSEISYLFDILHVSSGGIDENSDFKTFPGYQLSFAEYLKKELNKPVIAVGLLQDENIANQALKDNKADLIAIGRGLLNDPYWPLHAAKKLNADIEWPKAYLRAKIIDSGLK